METGPGIRFPGSGTARAGQTIIGHFIDGKMDGECKYEIENILEDGYKVYSWFQGIFSRGIWEGPGKEINVNGDTFEGYYVKDAKTGKGKQYINSTKTTYEGVWKDN